MIYYKVVRTTVIRLISVTVNFYEIEYVPGKRVFPQEGTPIFVFQDLQCAKNFADGYLSSLVQIWKCDCDELFSHQDIMARSLLALGSADLVSFWKDITTGLIWVFGGNHESVAHPPSGTVLVKDCMLIERII